MTQTPDNADVHCEHGVPEPIACEECEWEQSVRDDQAADDDWMFDPRWKPQVDVDSARATSLRQHASDLRQRLSEPDSIAARQALRTGR